MANKIKYGLRKVHVAFLANGAYETPIHVPGAVNMTLDPEGSESPFHADDSIYYSQKKNNGYSGSLEMALFPDAVKARMLGDYIDSAGNYVEDAEGTPCPFALLFEVQGDEKARRTAFYEVTASRPSENAQTVEDDITPQTETADITAVPHTFGTIDKKVPKLTCHQGETDYENFFEAVVEPKAAPAASTQG